MSNRPQENHKLESQSVALIIISGPTAAGKSEAQTGLLKTFLPLQKIVTYTTRSIREKEVDGEDYHFINHNEFTSGLKAGEFLEFDEYGGEFYGTKTADLLPLLSGVPLTWILTMPRALTIDEYITKAFQHDVATAQRFLDQKSTILVTTPDREQLKERYLKREERSLSDYEKRLAKYEKRVVPDLEFVEANKDKFDHVVFNREGELAETIRRVNEIFRQKQEALKRRHTS